jgi:hypothetical protein
MDVAYILSWLADMYEDKELARLGASLTEANNALTPAQTTFVEDWGKALAHRPTAQALQEADDILEM